MQIRWRTFLVFLMTVSSARVLCSADGPPALPPTAWPALEQAAAADSATRHQALLGVADDAAAPPHVRALALLGAAGSAPDGNRAMAIWRRLADDAAAPRGYRDEARRRMAEDGGGAEEPALQDGAERRAALPTLPTPAVVLHVSSQGDDAAPGSQNAPLATLAGARDAVRKMRAARGGQLPEGGVHILVHGGTYPASGSFVLGAEDSGTDASPIVYQAAPGETPILDGGVGIPSWLPVSDKAIKSRLDPAVRDRVREADLAGLGVQDYGDATDLRRAPELFIDGVPQTLARWPDDGFVATGEILGSDTFTVWGSIQGCRDGKFRYVEDRAGRWVDESDVRLYGYWFWDWYEQFQKVAAIDAEAKSITLAKPYSQYGYRKGQRYRAVNVLRELDQPGEWYLDRRSGKLYWLPPEGDGWTRAVAKFSVFAQPFVQLDGAQHVVLAGLTIEDGRGDGIHVRGGAKCLIAGCTLRRLGGDALVLQDGREHTIFGCTMHTLGCGGARVAGGDRATLTAGGHVVENCTVADIARLKRTYAPAVHLDGCGNRIAHNRFERIPSSAMRIEGNEHVIELNAIRHVVQESDDQGGLDMFGNPLYRGVVVRWNRWSDITGGTHCGAAGVRLDDMISGVTIYGNVFERCGAALFGGVQIHGGKENTVDNNLFLDCFAGLSFSRWGEKRWGESIARFQNDAAAEPYATRYPELARLADQPDINWVTRNVFVRCGNVFLRDGGIQRAALNMSIEGPFAEKVIGDSEALERDRRLAAVLAAPIPLDEIGTYDHPWRAAAP